jgi:hypothetical protein
MNFKRLKMKNTLYTLLIMFFVTSISSAQNGYTLEFEDVVTLSVESDTIIPAGTVTKTYTVPANCVLKISSGCLFWSSSLNANLKVGSEIFSFRQTNANNVWQPIWAKAGTTITLTSYLSTATVLHCGFISGTLFRKVAN